MVHKRQVPRPRPAKVRDIDSPSIEGFSKTLELLMADNPFGRAIPAPCGFLTLQVNTAEPSIDAVQVDVVCSTFKNPSPCFCDPDVTKPVLKCVRYVNEWMPSR